MNFTSMNAGNKRAWHASVRLEILDEGPRLGVRLEFVNKFLQMSHSMYVGKDCQHHALAVASSLVRCLMTLNILYLPGIGSRS
jgi:hypothetical protein